MTRPGSTLLTTIIFLVVISFLVMLGFDRATNTIRTTSRRINDQEALRIAEAGIEKALWCLNSPSNTTDCPGNPNFPGESNVVFGRGSYTSIVSGGMSDKTVRVNAVVNGAGGEAARDIKISLTTSNLNPSFQYGLQAGVGGLELKNNNKIVGNVFSGGPVTGDKSVITGDAVLTVGEPTLDASSDPSVDPLNLIAFGRDGNANDVLAQSFVPTVTDKIQKINLKLARRGATSTVNIRIFSDSGNNPGSDLTGGGDTLSSPVDESSNWESAWTEQTFSPPTNPVLAAGQKYWLVLSTSGVNNTNYWVVVRDTDNNTYTSPIGYLGPTPQAKLDGDTAAMPSACTGAGCDIAFEIYLGGVSNTLKMGCTGATLCIDNKYAVGGNVYAETIDSTNIKQHACYQNIIGTVQAGKETATCNGSSSAPIPCDEFNTVYDTGPYCHQGNETVEPVDFPLTTAQIAILKETAAANTTSCPTGCTISSGTIGPRKYVGNVTIDGGVTLAGTVWVKGNLTISDTITLADSYGTDSGTIVADNPDDPVNSGRIIVSPGGNALGNIKPKTYIMLLSMSKTLDDSNGAVDVSNNLTAGVVYAANGSVVLKNSANLKEVTGQRIVLQNGSEITYESGLASVIFSGGPGASWTYKPGSYQIIE